MFKFPGYLLPIFLLNFVSSITSLPEAFALPDQDTVLSSQGDPVDETNIFVSDLAIDGASVAEGGSIHGSFRLVNWSGIPATEITLKVSLAGPIGENAGMPVYDTWVMADKIALKDKEEKTIQFTYPVPVAVAGKDLTLLIRAFLKSGIPLGWQGVPVKVLPDILKPAVKLVDAAVVVGAKGYKLQQGPTLKAGDAPALSLLFSPGNEHQVVSPFIRIFTRDQSSGEKVYEEALAPIRIEGKKDSVANLPLPVFNYKPGVYAGVLDLTSGGSRLSSLNFRYIIGGDQAAIDAISSSQQRVKEGEKFQVTVRHAGPPMDIDTNLPAGQANGLLTLSIFNEDGDLVAEQSAPFDVKHKRTTFDLLARRNAEALSARAKVVSEGKNLAEFYVSLANQVTEEKGDVMSSMLLLGGVLLALASATVFLLSRRAKALVSLVLLCCALASGNEALAYTSTEQGEFNMVDLTGVTVKKTNGSLFAQGSMAGGASFYVEGNILAHNCTNDMSVNVQLSATNVPDGTSYNIEPYNPTFISGGNCTDEDHNPTGRTVNFRFGSFCHNYESSKTFRVGPFKAPAARARDRTYRVNLVTQMTGFHGQLHNEIGYIEYVVRARPPANCTGPDGSVILHGSSKAYYRQPIVAYGQSCQAENRTCTDGVLSGTFTAPSCVVGPHVQITASSPNPTVGSKVTINWTSSNTASCDASQGPGFDTGKMTSGSDQSDSLNKVGDQIFEIACTGPGGRATAMVTVKIAEPANCIGPDGVQILHGSSRVYYLNAVEPFGGACRPEIRSCSNGVLSGSYLKPSCAVIPPNDCLGPDGTVIPHGESKIYYKAAAVPNGSSCIPETRTCTNGTLSGTFAYPSCAPNPPLDCTGPDGVTIGNGESRTYYFNATVPAGSTCSPEGRVCNNGGLSGSASFSSCSVLPGGTARKILLR